jgi:hypothetical protein
MVVRFLIRGSWRYISPFEMPDSIEVVMDRGAHSMDTRIPWLIRVAAFATAAACLTVLLVVASSRPASAFASQSLASNEQAVSPVGAGSVVLYDPVSGGVSVVDVKGGGDGFTTPAVSGTILGADIVGTAYLGGPDPSMDDVLFYSSTTGRFQFASIGVDSGLGRRDFDVFVDVIGTPGWTHVITGDYNGDGTGDVLFYRASDGLMRFYTTSASGAFTPITPAYNGSRGWTHLVVGDFNSDGSDDVMWYRARDGLIRFYEVTDAGEFRAITPAHYGTRNWTTIPAGDYNGDGTDDVMFYRKDGVARFYEVDGSGTFRALGAVFDPGSNFIQIESVEFTPATTGEDLAWYHAGDDVLTATRYDTNNVVDLWNPLSTTSYGDDLTIATGIFLPSSSDSPDPPSDPPSSGYSPEWPPDDGGTRNVESWRSTVLEYWPADRVDCVLGIIYRESRGDPTAHNRSSDAMGLMQHLLKYWPARAKGAGFVDGNGLVADPFNGAANITAGAWLADYYSSRGLNWWIPWSSLPSYGTCTS